MILKVLVFAVALAVAVAPGVAAEDPSTGENTFTFPDEYTMSGYIFKPSFNIRKPFIQYNDRAGQKSRFEIYGGDATELQNAPERCLAFWAVKDGTHVPHRTCACLDDAFISPSPKYEFVRVEACDTDTMTIYASIALRNITCDRFEHWLKGALDSVLWVKRDSVSGNDFEPLRMLELGSGKTELIYLSYTPRIANKDVFDLAVFKKENNCEP